MPKKAGKIALTLGLITGAITGFLFAPEEGKKIRSKIAKGDTEGLLNDVKKMGEDIAKLGHDFMNHPEIKTKRDELDKMLKNANQKAEDFKKTVAKYVKEQKALLQEELGEETMPTKKKAAPKKKAPAKKTTVKKAAPKKKAPAKKKNA